MINVGSSKIDFIAYTNCVYQMPIQGLTLVKQNSIRFIVVHVLYVPEICKLDVVVSSVTLLQYLFVPEDIFLCDDPKETTIVCDKSLRKRDVKIKISRCSSKKENTLCHTWRKPSFLNISTTVSIGVWNKILISALMHLFYICRAVADLISDGNGGKVNNFSKFDGGRAAANNWHVVGEDA